MEEKKTENVDNWKTDNSLSNEWRKLSHNSTLLTGNLSQAHKKFKGHNQQGAAIGIVACAFAYLKHMRSWKKDTLDKILEVGDNLYHKSRQIGSNRCREHLSPTHIYKYFYLGSTQVSMKIEKSQHLKAINDRFFILNLINFFEDFFKKHKSGILVFNQIYLTVWQFGDKFFIFDSTEYDQEVTRWSGPPGLGVCILLRFNEITQLAATITCILPLKYKIFFTIYPCKVEKIVKVNTKPPETLETQVKKEEQPLRKVLFHEEKETKPKPEEVVEKSEKTQPEPEPKPPEEDQQVEEEVVKKVISESVVPPQRPQLQEPTKYTVLLENVFGILHASNYQNAAKFTKEQGLANALAALCMLRVYKSKFWNKDIVSDILRYGDVIFKKYQGLPDENQEISIKDKSFTSKVDTSVVGHVISTDPNVFSLGEALTNHFLENDCGILQIEDKVLALWKEDNKFYVFEPNPCNHIGTIDFDNKGQPCVMWFTSVNDYENKILLNLTPKQLKWYFLLRKVTIEDKKLLAEDWFGFKPLSSQKWILRGTKSQKDPTFPEDSRNQQCTAIAAIALAYNAWTNIENWNSDTVDSILERGDQYYHICIEYLQQNSLFKHPHLMVAELYKSFDMGEQRFFFEIEDCLVNGIINSKEEAIFNLERGLVEFFEKEESGIITANDQSMSIWKCKDAFFYFDSHSRDPEGVACSFGTACIIRSTNIEDLNQCLLTNLKADQKNLFNISRVDIKIVDITDDGFIKPPLNNYTELTDHTTIIRSNFSQKHHKYDLLHNDKQTIPNCLAALAMHLIISAENWKSEDVDSVLNVGDKLFQQSMAALYESNQIEINSNEISTDNVAKAVFFGINLLSYEFENFSSGNFEKLDDSFDLLINKLNENKDLTFMSILESPLLTVAIWRDGNLFYLFDPKPRDERGQVYGKDSWSIKIVEEEEQIQEKQVEAVVADENLDETVEESDEEAVEKPADKPVEETNEIQEETVEDDEIVDQDEGEEGFPPPVEKKDSAYWRIEEEKSGKACVLRFSRLGDLHDHLVNNTPPNKREENEFTWTLVTMTNTPVKHDILLEDEETEDENLNNWHSFIEIDYGKWILRSHRSLDDETYLEANRGQQEIPSSIMSLSFANIYNPKWYNSEVVDKIMDYGDRLLTVLKRLKRQQLKTQLPKEEIDEIVDKTPCDITEFPTQVCIHHIALKTSTELDVSSGDITSTIEEVPDLARGLQNFFEKKQFGILKCNNYAVSIWQIDNFFYMFDPHRCGPSGLQSPVGVACITRFANLEDLAKLYKENLPKIGEHFFGIHAMSFQFSGKCPINYPPKEEEEGVKNLGGFGSITAGKAILRGGNKPKCDDFSRGVHIHSSPIGLVALALSKIRDPLTWTKLIVDQVVEFGREVYEETLEKLGDRFNRWEHDLEVADTNHDFQVGVVRVNWDVPPEERIWGKINVKNSPILNLRQGFEKFFEVYCRGVLLVQRFKLAVWKQNNEKFLYLFDPNSRGATGLPTHGGVACVMRFHDAKLAADHVITCLQTSEPTTVFLFVPINMITKIVKSPKKKTCKLQVKTIKEPSPKPYTGTPVTCPKKAEQVLQHQALAQITEEKAAKCRQKQVNLLGELSIYQVNNRESLIRGIRPLYKNSDLSVNYVAFTYFTIEKDLDSWSWYNIEMILQLGQQLHIDSILAYKLPEKQLQISEVLRTFDCLNNTIKLKVHRPLVFGELTKSNLVQALERVFLSNVKCFLFGYGTFVVTICFKSGFYYMFDPYNRDTSGNKTDDIGSAVLVKFTDLDALAEKIVRNFGEFHEEFVRKFVFVFLEISVESQNVSRSVRNQ